ncbi:MAG: hypothetical protein U5L11_02895 [Arhodomonas sp.]|nr:hypothetical protein [Arhodomonas sp.]
MQESLHWTWEFEHPDTGQLLGKRHVVNSFCGTVASNEPRCTSCHAGYGWEDMREPAPTAERQVDVSRLPRHHRRALEGSARRRAIPSSTEPQPTDEGVRQPPDLGVSPATLRPQRTGELRQIAVALLRRRRRRRGEARRPGLLAGGTAGSLDVHMSPDGAGLVCSDCHTAGGHQVTGSRYATKPFDPHGIDVPGHSDETRSSCWRPADWQRPPWP